MATCAKFKRKDSVMDGVNFEIPKVYTCGMCETILEEDDRNLREEFVTDESVTGEPPEAEIIDVPEEICELPTPPGSTTFLRERNS
ncbi:hypothetical protein G5I_08681 [Acromyrmex echinatior]|uniref:Uncharacterized protein n=1 Tax=Acromyrmex echinatior TaxID=103372 RepID=F4WS69_ACREC|nr:hypothetical protein G5I_08681 [Acromyrmex echinatior]